MKAEERARAAEDGTISEEDAHLVANTVKNQHPSFATITPVKGDSSWNYGYTLQREDELHGSLPAEGNNLPPAFNDTKSIFSLQYGGTRRYATVEKIGDGQVTFTYKNISGTVNYSIEEIQKGEGTLWKLKGQSASPALDE
jgi:hypothetical protein